MPLEIERKFLVTSDGYRCGTSSLYRQGYLNTDPDRTVRVRITGDTAALTIKGRTTGATRPEFEYPIPFEEAEELLALCERPLIEKRRWLVPFEGMTWEVDEFFGDNDGLVVAEIELADESQKFAIPAWIGDEVTDDPRYFNANLARQPYSTWASKGDNDERN